MLELIKTFMICITWFKSFIVTANGGMKYFFNKLIRIINSFTLHNIYNKTVDLK